MNDEVGLGVNNRSDTVAKALQVDAPQVNALQVSAPAKILDPAR